MNQQFTLIEKLLEARSYIEWRNRLSTQAINRRQFLTGAAATAATMATSSAHASQSPTVARDTQTGVITVSFKGLTWTIDPRRFSESDGKKPLTVEHRLPTRDPVRPRFFIRLAHAGLAGIRSSIRADLETEIYAFGSDWRIRLKFRSMPRAVELDLTQWLSRAAGVTEPTGGERVEFGLGKTAVTIPRQGAQLSIDSEFTFRVEGYDRPLELEIGGTRADIDGLTLRPQTGGSALLSAIATVPGGAPVTLVEVPCVKPRDGHIAVGRLPDGEDFSLHPGQSTSSPKLMAR